MTDRAEEEWNLSSTRTITLLLTLLRKSSSEVESAAAINGPISSLHLSFRPAGITVSLTSNKIVYAERFSWHMVHFKFDQ